MDGQPHFAHEKSEAHRDRAACLRSPSSQETTSPGRRRLSGPQSLLPQGPSPKGATGKACVSDHTPLRRAHGARCSPQVQECLLITTAQQGWEEWVVEVVAGMCGGGEGRRWWEWTRSTGSHCSASAEGSRMAPSGTCLSQVGNGLARWGIASWLGGPCCDPWEESGKVNQNLLQYRGVAHRHTRAVAKANELTHAKPWAPRPCLINGPLLLLVTSLFPLSLFSSPVPAGTLLHRDKQPHLSGTERGSGKSSQVPRPPSKTAQS